jgi:peptidoglycan/LPS O-acetylase OafA/YrhL
MKNKIQYLILAFIIIIALGLTFYKNLSYNYEMQGNLTDITEAIFNNEGFVSEGYEITQNADHSQTFTVTNDDPKLIIDLSKFYIGKTGGVELAYKSADTINVQVFYARDNESYSERHSAKSELASGEGKVIIPITLDTYSTLRIDIDGDFTLYNINISDNKTTKTPYISTNTINKCLWYFPAIIISFTLIFWAHKTKYKSGNYTAKGYIENIFLGAKPSPNRETYLDYMRVLAAVLVILAHTCSPYVDQADTSWKRLILVMGLGLGLCCNIIYVMLSGTLLLSAKKDSEESVINFYLKRASKVIIPLIVYYLLLLSLNNEVSFLPPKNIGAAFKRIVTGAPDAAPHLWLIYTIVALYFVTPFFKVMVSHLSDKLMFSLWAVIIILNILTTYLPIFGMTFGATSFLAGWEGVFLLGYILTRQNNLKNSYKRNRYLMIAAVISYIISVIVVFKDSALMNYVYGNTTAIIIVSCGIFAFFVENKDKFKNKSNPVIRLCSKYSYSIILIHWYALFVVVADKLHITALRFGCIGGIAATVLATLVSCIIMAIVIDNTAVIVLNTAFDKLCAIKTQNKN